MVTLMVAVLTSACSEGGTTGPGAADRTIEVQALDELAFDPETIEVSVGETVRFVVTNTGQNDHEFVVGDAAVQEMAEQQAMEGMHGHGGASTSLTLEPGQTREATVTFEGPGELLYGCHVNGHYEGGMVGTISIAV
jgi:uncharacterized cupredoxin-like copper-binding protein